MTSKFRMGPGQCCLPTLSFSILYLSPLFDRVYFNKASLKDLKPVLNVRLYVHTSIRPQKMFF